jgi:hypothetical protein
VAEQLVTTAVLLVAFLAASIVGDPAVAAAGWYLLQPPIAQKQENDLYAFVYITNSPLSRWYRLGVFDTAKECTAERQRRLTDARRDATLLRNDKLGRSFSAANLAAMEASECVASDDRRLLK